MGHAFLDKRVNEHKLYRIVPHRTVLNSQNRRMWSMAHDIMSLYEPFTTRVNRRGKQVVFKERDDMWWVVRLSYVEDEPKVEFFISVTETFNEVFKLRLANHEQWSKNTLLEASVNDIWVPEEKTLSAQLRPVRDNMFSFDCDYQQQASPIRTVVDISRQLKKGDVIVFAMNLRCVSRMKWKRMVEYSWKKWNEGKVPQRNVIKTGHVVRGTAKLFAATTNEVTGILEDTLKGIEGSFFKGESRVKLGKIEIADTERQQLLVDGKLSRETEHKQNLPVFKTRMYVFAHSEDSVRRAMLAQSLAGAYNELNGNNRFTLVHDRKQSVVEFNRLRVSGVDRDPIYLSTDEVGKIAQLPTAQVQEEYADAVQANRRIEVEVPSVFRDEKGVFMGVVTKKENDTDVYLPINNRDMLFTPRAFVASPRMGKDTAIVNFIVEAKRKHGIGSIILDAIDEPGNDRGMADSVRDSLPAEDIIDLNFGDYDYPIYLGLQGITSPRGNERIMRNRIAQELTSFLMGDEPDGSRMFDYLFACAQLAGADPVLIRELLVNDVYRANVLANTPPNDATALLQQFSALGGLQNQIASPVLTRLSKIMRDEFLKPIFGQAYNSDVNWAKWMKEGKVVIVRIPSRDLGPLAVKTIMHWLTLVIFLTKVAGHGGETFVVFNEPHQYETKGWLEFVERMLLEGPKYRIAPIFAFHLFKKLSKGFVETLMSSGVNWHIGNNSSVDVFEQLKDVLQPTFEKPEEAKEQVKRFQFIAAWRDNEGQYQHPFIYTSPPPAVQRYGSFHNEHVTLEHSKRYGRPLDDVLNEMRTRGR